MQSKAQDANQLLPLLPWDLQQELAGQPALCFVPPIKNPDKHQDWYLKERSYRMLVICLDRCIHLSLFGFETLLCLVVAFSLHLGLKTEIYWKKG